METVVIAAWVALSVLVVWYAAATTVLKRQEAKKAAGTVKLEETAPEEFLEAQSAALGSAWDTIREADRPAG